MKGATRTLAAAAMALAAFGLSGQALAEAIKLGEINSYSRLPQFTDPYKKGWTLALEQINAKGGVKGRQIEVIDRDDAGKPANAVKIAEELIAEEGVAFLWGGFLSNVGLAISDIAARREVMFLATEPLSDALVWSKGNRFTYRLRPSTTMQAAMLAERATKLPATKWATVAPNYAYGKDAVAAFEKELKKRKPEVEFIEAQWPPLFKIDAGPTVRALEAAKPDAIYNVTFGPDLAKFVREGALRGLFEGRAVVSLLTGEPEYLDPLGAEAPEGWIVTGYPPYAIEDEGHVAFATAYEARWGEAPKTGSVVGYNSMLAIEAVLTKAASLETEDLLAAMEGLTFSSPISGEITFREIDNQSTMGAWVGLTARDGDRGIMVDWTFADGADYLPSDEEVRALRPAE